MPEMCSGGGELLDLIGGGGVGAVLFCLFPFFSSSYFFKNFEYRICLIKSYTR